MCHNDTPRLGSAGMENVRQIGARQGAQISQLLAAFDKVRGVAGREFAPLLDAEKERLREWRARTAAIGQVKAGKSTFLSALVGQPGFLPSEVNPWTSVITNLHFGHPDDPSSGGVFHFFAEADWRRIIEGNKKTRELAEELLPGFDSETLRQQVETMRARAKQRLGKFYSVLLGGSHKYDRVTREMLDRYVCAGGEFETAAERTGRYSDITERADIYFPAGNWSVPAVVTDTPGVNDPFLVRDEFTCRSLIQSDVFMLILSAHQALTDVDIALVKMVSEHPGKRIVIVINRIDELGDFATNAQRVWNDVKSRIASIHSEVPVEVILGSAYWAGMVAEAPEDPGLIPRIANTPEMDRYLMEHYGSVPGEPWEKLWQASGLARVTSALDSAVTEGVGQRVLLERGHALKSLVMSIRTEYEAARREAVEAQQAHAADGSLSEAVQKTLASRSQEAENLATDLSEAFERIRGHSGALVDESWRSIRRELDMIGTAFIERQSENLRHVIAGQEAQDGSFDLSTESLRSELEGQARHSYVAARQRIDTVIDQAVQEIHQITRPLLGEAGLQVSLVGLPHDEVLPLVATTNQTLTLELTTKRGWRFWENARMNEAESLRALKEIIRAEFYPSINSMTELVHNALVARSFEAMRRLEVLTNASIEAAKHRAQNIAPDGTVYTQEELGEKINLAIAQIDERIGVLAEVEADLPKAPKNAVVSLAESA